MVDPEVRLIIECAKLDSDGAAIRTLASADLNWEDVLEIARVNTVTPLLERGLSEADVGLPEPFDEKLSERVRSIAIENLARVRELGEILDEFDKAGIDAIPYKGPVLADMAYGDVTRREYLDLDILVRRADLELATGVLLGRGYQREGEMVPGVGYTDGDGVFTTSAERLFRRMTDDVMVELRWGFGRTNQSVSLSFEQLWDRREMMALGGRTIERLRFEETLLVLAQHGVKHGFSRLAWVADIAHLVGNHVVDWDRLVRLARVHGMRTRLVVALHLARDCFDVNIPDETIWGLDAPGPGDLLVTIARNGLVHQPTDQQKELRRVLFRAAATDSLGEGIKSLGKVAFSPTLADYRTVRLPRPLHWLYYPLRPGLLALRYLQRKKFSPRQRSSSTGMTGKLSTL